MSDWVVQVAVQPKKRNNLARPRAHPLRLPRPVLDPAARLPRLG